jgi:hypothetical protein
MGLGVIDDFTEKLLAERGQRALPQLARGLAHLDETPLLGGDGAGIHAVREMVHGAARDRIAFPDGPFHRCDAAVPGQQRGVIADTAEFCGGQRRLADTGVAVRGHDQIGAGCDLRSGHEPGFGLHDNLDPGGLRRSREPVLGIGHDDPDDVDTMLAQHIESRHAEMAGADEGNPHGGPVRLGPKYQARR